MRKDVFDLVLCDILHHQPDTTHCFNDIKGKLKRLLNALNWIYEKKPISDHQPDTYKVKLKSKFSAAAASRVCDILLHINHLISLKKRRATSFAFDDDQNDMQYVLWDKIMCVGSDLMQNKGNKVSERVFFFPFQSGLH